MATNCECCEGLFERKGKGYKRVSLSSKFRGGPSAAETLTSNFNINFTPGKAAFICDDCSRSIRSVHVKKTQLEEVEEKFRKIRKPGSYLAMKLATTPQHRQATKKFRVMSSPLHKSTSPKQSTSTEKISLTINKTDIGRAIQLLSQSKYLRAFRLLFGSSSTARKAAVNVIGDIVRREMVAFGKLMRKKDTNLPAILNFTWDNIIGNARSTCPSMLEVLTASLTKKHAHKSASKKRGKKVMSLLPVIGSLLSVLCQLRNRHSSILQFMVSLMMWIGGCKRKVFGSFNRLGWCQTIEATRKRIDGIRMEYDAKVLQWKENITNREQNVENEGQLDITLDALELLDDVWEETGEIVDSDASSEEAHVSDSEEVQVSEDSEDETSEEQITSISEDISSVSIPNVEASCDIAYYDITFDNINQKIGVRHHVRGKKAQMLNMVNGYACKERIGSFGLSNDMPSSDTVRNIPIADLLPSDGDEILLKNELEVIVTRILSSYIQAFKDVETVESIPHIFSEQSTHKSEIVPIGVLNKDEASTAGMIDILDHYKKYVPVDSNNNPMKFILYCDGLSCERMEGAQRARVNGADAMARLDMFQPAIQEWHRRLMFVQDTYDELFNFDSQREKGTLFNLKQVYDHKNVSKNVMENFDKAEELLVFATEGYTLLSAMDKLGIETLDDPLPNDKVLRDRIAKEIVAEVFGRPNTAEVVKVAVDKNVDAGIHCICKLDIGGLMVYCCNGNCERGTWFHLECLGMDEDEVIDEDWFCSDGCKQEKSKKGKKSKTVDKFLDSRYDYGKRLLWRGLNDIARHDAVRENDGPRMIRHWKYDMFEFYEKNHPKYFIFGHRLLANIAGATSERIRHGLMWERTINVKGGKRKNIPKDLHCEHLNMEYKKNSRDAAGQLTEKTVARHSQMIGLGKTLNTVFEEQVVTKPKSYTRKHGQVDRTSDIKRMVKSLHPLRFFQHQAGRSLKGYEHNAQVGVRFPKKFKERLQRHLNNMAKLRALNE